MSSMFGPCRPMSKICDVPAASSISSRISRSAVVAKKVPAPSIVKSSMPSANPAATVSNST